MAHGREGRARAADELNGVRFVLPGFANGLAILALIGAGAGVVQEHEAPAAEAVAGQAEEWSTELMLHDITDGPSVGIGSISVPLPTFEPLHIGPLTVDLSITKHVFFLFVTTFLTILTMWIAARRAAHPEQAGKAPRGFLNLFETFYIYLRDEVALANIGHGGERFVPYVVTLFFFILYANFLGLVPFGATATSNIMVTTAMALISLAVIEVSGFLSLGPRGYLGTIFYLPKGLPVWMRPIMLVVMTPVEIIGKLAKPFALAVRLFANMSAGHFVLLSLLGLILTYGSFTHTVGWVAILGPIMLGLFVMFLEIFVALLQAYIFTILTAVFIGLIRQAH